MLSLQGECGGQLPQYVALFNGQSGKVTLPGGQTLLGATPTSGTLTAWVLVSAYPVNTVIYQNDEEVFLYVSKTSGNGYTDGANMVALEIPWNLPKSFYGVVSGSIYNAAGMGTASLNKWYFLAITFTNSGGQAYVNGASAAALGSPGTFSFDSFQSSIGSWKNSVQYASGAISNVQIYNTSLSANEIKALYSGGIGGAPLVLQNLVGWWPLNGDVKDYSGNGNGAQTSVPYSSQWASTYTVH